MAAEAATDAEIGAEPKKKGLLIPIVIGVVLAALGGGGAFWATTAGPLKSLFGGADAESAEGSEGEKAGGHLGAGPAPLGPVAFLPLEVLAIPLGVEGQGRTLIFEGQLELDPQYLADVTLLKPRVLDVLNSYLRVVEVAELGDPAALLRLRGQMLRRVQVVTGEGRVRDLLITQFVVN